MWRSSSSIFRAGCCGRSPGGIECLGATRQVQLVEAGRVADLADLSALTREQLLALEMMGEARRAPTTCSAPSPRHIPA
jgi:NAD-dependent DNA ligase